MNHKQAKCSFYYCSNCPHVGDVLSYQSENRGVVECKKLGKTVITDTLTSIPDECPLEDVE